MKNRVYHRMCSLLLAALTIFAALPVITLPVSAAESISTGDSVTISRETEFVFTPAQSGTYSFYSDGITSGDPKGYLYDAGHTQLAVNDDSNSNRNFTLNYALTAGQTYYLTAGFFNNGTGSYTAHLDGPYSTMYATDFGTTVQKQTDYIFTPTESGIYRFCSRGIASGDPKGYLYGPDHVLLASNDDSNATRNFSVSYSLTAGTTYYLRAGFYNNGTGSYTAVMNGPYLSIAPGETVHVTGYSGSFLYTPTTTGRYHVSCVNGTCDLYDWDNDRNDYQCTDYEIYTTLIAGRQYVISTAYYGLSSTGEYDVTLEGPEAITAIAAGEEKQITVGTEFTFVPKVDGTYRFYSYDRSGRLPTGCLYDSNHKQLASGHSIDNYNFELECSLVSGKTYYLHAFFSEGNGGSYSVKIEGPKMTPGSGFNIGSPTEFYFVPTMTGLYRFWSANCSGDPYGRLYNADHTLLSDNDNCGDGTNNFRVEYSLTAGRRYYLQASCTDSSTVKYTANLTMVSTYPSVELGDAYYVEDAGEFVFIPPRTAIYRFYSYDNTGDPYAILYNADHQLLSRNDDGNGDGNFSLQASLTAGEPYYLRAMFYNNGTGSYTFSLEQIYTELTDGGSAAVTNERYFRFVPARTGRYRFYSTGDNAEYPQCFLYDADYNMLYDRHSGGEGKNFMIEWTLYAGQTYYLKAGYINGGTGSYTIHAEEVYEELENGVSVSHTIELTFTPSASGYYRFYSSYSAKKPIAYLYDASHTLIASDVSGSFSFSIEAELASGQTYYLLATAAESDVFDYTVFRESLWLNIESGDDIALYRVTEFHFTPTESGMYRFYTTSANSTNIPHLILYDADRNMVGVEYSMIDNYNRELKWNMIAGRTYILKADHLTFFDTGGNTYGLHLEGPTAIPAIVSGGSADVTADTSEFVFVPAVSGVYRLWADDMKSTSKPKGGLYDADHIRLAYTDGSVGNSIIFEQELEAGKTYYLRAGEGSTGAGDHFTARLSGPYLTVDTFTTVESPAEFIFTPTVTGLYCFYSTDNTGDPSAILYNAGHERICSDDDGGGNRNFMIIQPLTAGRDCYLNVSIGSGSCCTVVTLSPETLPALTTDVPVSVMEEAVYLFVPQKTGTYHFYSTDCGSGDPDAKLYDADYTLIAEGVDTEEDPNFLIEARLTAGETYYVSAAGAGYTLYAEEYYHPLAPGDEGFIVSTTDYIVRPATSGSYVFSFNNSFNTPKAELFDAEWNPLTFTTSGGGGRDFWHKSDLRAGETYYLIVTPGGSTTVSLRQETLLLLPGDAAVVDGTVEFPFTPAVSGRYNFWSSDRIGDPRGYLYDDAHNLLIYNDDRDGAADRNFFFSYILTAGETYYVKGDFYSNGTGSFILHAEGPTIAVGESIPVYEPTEFFFVPEEDGFYTFWSTDSGDIDPRFFLYDAGHEYIAEDDDGAGDMNFSLTYELIAGETYYLLADFYDECTGSYTFHLDAPTPIITDAPVDTEAVEGEQAAFSVTATGIGLSYRWQIRRLTDQSWADIGVPSAATANLSFSVDRNMDGAQVRVVVTDPFGRTSASAAATLTVYVPIVPGIDITIDRETTFVFTPETTAIYRFYSNVIRDVDPRAVLYDQLHNQLTKNDDGFGGRDFSIRRQLTAGTTYYLTVSFLDDNAGSTVVRLAGPFAPISAGETVTVSGKKGFIFTPEESGAYRIRSFRDDGVCDPAVQIFNGSMQPIGSDDNGNGGRNFMLEVELEAGKIYYLETGFNNVGGGSYFARLESCVPAVAEGAGWYIDGNGCLHITGRVTNPGTADEADTPWIAYTDRIRSVVAEEGAAVDNCVRLFEGCSLLTSADLSLLDTTGCAGTCRMFRNCTDLITLNLGGLDTRAVTDMSEMFSGCASLGSLDLSGFSAAALTDASRMLEGCLRLKEIKVNGDIADEIADSLLELCPQWVDHTSGSALTTEEEIQAITGVSVLVMAHIVTFDGNGHGGDPVAMVVEDGYPASAPEDLTESGWAFSGWYLDAACTVPFDPTAPITEDTTVYAKWLKIIGAITVDIDIFPPAADRPASYSSYTFVDPDADYEIVTTYWYGDEDENGDSVGELGGDDVILLSCAYSRFILLRPKEGCVFDEEAVVRVVDNEGNEITLDGDFSYVREDAANLWTVPVRPVEYVIFYNAWGGAGCEIPKGTVMGEVGEPGREGFLFDGWYTDEALEHPYDPTAPVMEDTTLYPRWRVAGDVLPGDLNGDGTLTIVDVSLLLIAIANNTETTAATDINGDGVTSIADVSALLNRIAGVGVNFTATIPAKFEL